MLETAQERAQASAQLRQNLALLYALRGDLDRSESLVRGDLGGERVEIAHGERLDVGVDGGGGDALVLADLGGDVDGSGKGKPRVARCDQLQGLPLVPGIGIGVQEGDGERADALANEPRCGIEQGGFVQRQAHAAVDGRALGHLQSQMAGDQRRRLRDVDVVELVLALAADLERVAEAPGRDEAARGTLALDDGEEPLEVRVEPRQLSHERRHRRFVERLAHAGAEEVAAHAALSSLVVSTRFFRPKKRKPFQREPAIWFAMAESVLYLRPSYSKPSTQHWR